MIKKVKKQKAKGKSSSQKAEVSVFIFLLVFLPFYCYCQPVTSTELIINARQYDGKEVVYSGEVIGEVMRRGGNAWANINDGNNAIGVWLDNGMAENIGFTGSYKSKGDFVEITGVFNRACQEHGGDLDIHARSLRKLSSGRALTENINSGKIRTAVIFLGVLCLILILRFLSRK